MVLLKAFFVWLGIIVAESLQGMMRTLLVAPLIGEFTARQAAVATGSLLVLLITWLAFPAMNLRNAAQALRVGLFWVVLTILFELGIGRLGGATWQRLLEDYDLRHGGLLPLGLIVMLLAPSIVMTLRGQKPSS